MQVDLLNLGVTATAILALAAVARWCVRERPALNAGNISRRWLAEYSLRRHDPNS
jgi:hypothetical protein